MSQTVLRGYINKFYLIDLDDIIVYSNNWEDHMLHLSLVLERLEIHYLTCSVDKCSFGQTEQRYFGHFVSSDDNVPQEGHIEAVLQAGPPQSKRGLQQFLEICNWIRKYVPNFLETAVLLTELLKSKRWNLIEEADKAFLKVKEHFRGD